MGQKVLHLTNGDSVADKLRMIITSTEAVVLAWREMLIDGPIQADMDETGFVERRAAYFEEKMGVPAAEFIATQMEQQATLGDGSAYAEIVLWFEHDLFDQTLLLYVLDRMRRLGVPHEKLKLLMIGSFPGVEPFYGLGQLTEAQLSGLVGTERPVTPVQLALAAEAWAAYASPDPAAVPALLRDRDLAPLPYLAAALALHLQRYPSRPGGLGVVERQTLALLAGVPIESAADFTAATPAAESTGYRPNEANGDPTTSPAESTGYRPNEANGDTTTSPAESTGYRPNEANGDPTTSPAESTGYRPNEANGDPATSPAESTGYRPNEAKGDPTTSPAESTGYRPNEANGDPTTSPAESTGYRPNVANGVTNAPQQPQGLAPLFQAIHRLNPGYGLGDLQYWCYLDRMRSDPKPLLQIAGPTELPRYGRAPDLDDYRVQITAVGLQALRGEADAVTLNGIDRWLGGVHLTAIARESAT
ncbi:DUF1835 domain-containing protein [Paenibacillus swuensis]|uniref:DUF1835 domain-containing protein n=1 Tax=Paenibacillus swuensis TaxID=1178515 RepID=UPI000838FD80|nr:DUF1835 domain-containing protein [Paenibacillus swuensis]